ncbi:hypothetical protein DAPPUDRAFT_301404 [Daphnia pulex]|uniref:Uncharacterized protein n=1 Tax=Daphnia pulex TaxID=6669 RepID=E9HI49_DAPPU|nr:hypothetical protein DAPPUDRAFT_301404 [Daphnia pulex]|eukprot:EFX68596.1 hypothetical protein DAPPUDRAFT_301404 [Daphnia pulex]
MKSIKHTQISKWKISIKKRERGGAGFDGEISRPIWEVKTSFLDDNNYHFLQKEIKIGIWREEEEEEEVTTLICIQNYFVCFSFCDERVPKKL